MSRFPPRKILVAFDFTEPATAAVELARLMAEDFGGAAIDVVYVEETITYPVWRVERPGLTVAGQQEIARHVRRKVGPSPRVHVAEGEPSTEILRLIGLVRPDLVVMGTHGRTGLKRLWMGSVAEAVIRRSPAPVLATRGEAAPPRSVMAPVNFAEGSLEALELAAETAAAFRASLTVLHVISDPAKCREPEARLEAMIRGLPEELRRACRPKAVVDSASPVEGILKAARRHELIVMTARPRSLLEELVLGTTLERVLRLSPIPVMAVPVAPKRARVSRAPVTGRVAVVRGS